MEVYHNINFGKPGQTLFWLFVFRKALDLPLPDSKIPHTHDVQLYNPQAAALAQIYQEPYNDLVRLILHATGKVSKVFWELSKKYISKSVFFPVLLTMCLSVGI